MLCRWRYNTTLAQLWGTDNINRVTVHDLLGMTSGIYDYDDNTMEMFTIANPDKDITPLMYLQQVNKELICNGAAPPGCPAYYSSINYVLLGFVMQARHMPAAAPCAPGLPFPRGKKPHCR